MAIAGVEGSGLTDYNAEDGITGDGKVRLFDTNAQLREAVGTCSTQFSEHDDIQLSPCGYYFAVCGTKRGQRAQRLSALVFDIRKTKNALSSLSFGIKRII